jgi:REP element-mobilizing transposase RayT
MSNTYSQITIHAVFAVKYRANFIIKDWRDNLHQYIAGIINNKGAKSLAVGGWTDHVHLLFGMPVTTSLANFIGIIKSNSSKWINEQQLVKENFNGRKDMAHFLMRKASGML